MSKRGNKSKSVLGGLYRSAQTWSRCSQLRLEHHASSQRSIKLESSPAINGNCRRGARDELAIRVSADGFRISSLVLAKAE